MRKRLALLSTIFGSMFLLCVAVTGVAAMVDPRTLAVSVSVFLLGMLIIFVQYHYITAGTSRDLHQLGEEVHALQTEASIGHPLALTVVSDTGEIVWYNRKAEQLLDGSSMLQLYGRMISDFIGNTDFRQPTPEKGFGVRIGGRQYSMYANEYDSGSETEKLFALYFVDDHDLKHYTDLYFKTRPAVMRIMVDNYDELVQNARESDKTQVLSEIDYQITQFVEKYGGVVSQVEKDRYNAVFEDKFMQQIIQNRLDILDTIRKIEISDRVPCTLSIGIGREAPSISEADEMARQALEMALGRGGDQVAIYQQDGTYEFFGGKVAAAEKASKVRMRVIANAISRVVADCDKIFIMGHKFSDLDCVGAAIGLQCIMEKTFKRYSKVVINRETSMAKQLIEYTDEKLDTDIFISPEAALSGLTQKSLLIIVDTHLKRSLESTELYEKCKKVIIIDHHRKAVDYINNSLVFCHEPSASSTCEMCSEIISCLDDSPLTYVQADAMLAGITLDTKNFAVKTGVRTFEAAAYLRKRGANTLTVKGMFSDNIETYREKVDIVCKAHVYRGCAISIAPSGDGDIRLASAQAADEMLNLKGVDASFVLFEDNSQINISARSYGNVNVQIIMEKLGGGGHQTMAATQLKNTTKELAYQQLLSEIDNTLDDEENS